MKLYSALLFIFSFFLTTVAQATLLNIDPNSLEAEAWTVLDPQTGQIIAEHNSDVQRSPASLTKMMVAYIVLKEIKAGKISKDEVITATPVVNVVQWDESQMYLKPSEQISIDQLLAGLVIMSANDAAVTLAERVSGSLPAFIKRMNEEAKALGMKDTSFANPAGITMENHYSTAHDLALLGQALTTQTPEYLNYSKQQSFVYNQHYHRATNILLKQDSTVDGLKTGYTHSAGYNLALTAKRPTANSSDPERRLIVVVLGAKSGAKRAEIAYKLINLSFAYTRNEIALHHNQLIAELPVVQSTLKKFKVESKQSQVVTTSLYNGSQLIDMNHFDTQTQRLIHTDTNGVTGYLQPLTQAKTHKNVELLTKTLTAPIAQIQQLARVNIYQNNQLIQSFLIEDEINIEPSSWFEKLINWFKHIFTSDADSQLLPKIYPLN